MTKLDPTTRRTGPAADDGSRQIRAIPFPPRARLLRVARTEPLSATMVRIVLGGSDLEPEFPFTRLGAADHVKLAFPDPDTGQVTLPRIGRGEHGPAVESATLPVLRDYTVRAVDHAAGELTIDFAIHPHGPAGRWAARAGMGDQLGVLGPRGTRVYPGSFADYLLVADETGLPAVERFLTEIPPETPIAAFILASAAASIRDLPSTPVTAVRWLVLPDDAAASAAMLIDEISHAAIGPDTFVWSAGEAGLMKNLRTHLRERKLHPDQLSVRGYWRRGVAGPVDDAQ